MEAVIKRYIEESVEQPEEQQPQEAEAINATKARLEAERSRERKLMEKAMENSLSETPADEIAEKPLEITKATAVSPAEAELRQQYLRQQRDRLLALKRQERKKQLERFGESVSRPKSSRAAQRIVEEEIDQPSVDPKMLAFRKSLAARLKSEVVESKKE